MASRPQPTWVEASHLLPAEGGPKVHPVPWQQEVHSQSGSDTDGYPGQKQHFHPPGPYPSPVPVPVSPTHKPTFLQRLAGTWLFELLGLLVSVASLAGMVYILRRYDGQRIPNWGSLSFNTLISILAVVSKMAALYGATSAISQLKWVWFTENGKNLVDYKTFDSGSRGMTGAAMLAWSLKGRNAAVFGALAIIIGAAAGPFAQQIVHFYDADYVDIARTAWLSKVDTVVSLGPKRDSSTWTPDPVLKANAITSLFLPTQEALTQPQFSCPTGNCTWAPFTTLGFCPTCADISPQLNRNCTPLSNPFHPEDNPQSCTVAWPTGDNNSDPISLFYVAAENEGGSSTYMVVNSTSAINATSPVLQKLTWPYTIYQSIRAAVPAFQLGGGVNPDAAPAGEVENDGIHLLRTDTRFIGTECALTPCVRRLEASVSQGIYTEKVLDTFSTHDPYIYPNPITLSPPWAPTQNFTIHPEWLEAMSVASSLSLDLFGGQMKGTVSLEDSGQSIRTLDIPPFGEYAKENDALQAIFYADFTNTTCPTPEDNIQCAFRALAAAMTKSVRDGGRLKNGTTEPYIVSGQVNVTGIFIRVEWPWFALPVAIWFLSLLTVAAAMWKSRNVPLWRDSALPLVLLYGEHADAAAAAGNAGVREAELSARAETVKVHLVGDEGRGLRILTKQHY